MLAQDLRQPDEAGDDREERQDEERHGHRRRRLVDVVLLLGRSPELSRESQRDEPEHVEGRQSGRREAEGEENVAPLLEGSREDRVFREEAGQWRDAGQRERGR